MVEFLDFSSARIILPRSWSSSNGECCLVFFRSCTANQSTGFWEKKKAAPQATVKRWNAKRSRVRFLVWFRLSSAGCWAVPNTADEKRCKVDSRRKHHHWQRQRQWCSKTTGGKHNRNRGPVAVYVHSLGEKRASLRGPVAFWSSDALAGKLV